MGEVKSRSGDVRAAEETPRKRLLFVAVVISASALLMCFAGASYVLAAGDITKASCLNEARTGFSSALPECRAYEQVSPGLRTDENSSLRVRSMVKAISTPAGVCSPQACWRVAFPGAARSLCPGVEYVTSRESTGWTTTPRLEFPTEFTDAGISALKGSVTKVTKPSYSSMRRRVPYTNATCIVIAPAVAHMCPLVPFTRRR